MSTLKPNNLTSTSTRFNSKPWMNRDLSAQEREQFLACYEAEEGARPVFRWIKNGGKPRMALWLLWVALCCTLLSICMQNSVSFKIKALSFLFGVLVLQAVFVISHMEAHALFLEYAAHQLGNPRIRCDIVYWYAFYHHHHSRKDNWAPHLSHYNESGTDGIVCAHWMSYSALNLTVRTPIVILLSFLFPAGAWVLAGYEFAVFLLPLAHGWQHIDHQRIQPPPLRYLLWSLVKLGIIANRRDHKSHHRYDNATTVYQDFSSSGIYLVSVDRWLNLVWDNAFLQAEIGHIKGDKRKPYDYLVQEFTGPAKIDILLLLAAFLILFS